MKHILIGLLLACALAACASKSTPAPTSPTSTSPAASLIELGDIGVFDGDQPVFKIHADGTTLLGPKALPGPTISADGTMRYKGKEMARVNADGTIIDLASDRTLPVQINGESLIVKRRTGEATTFEITAEGGLQARGAGAPLRGARVEGADTAGKRRLVLALTALLQLSRSDESQGRTRKQDAEVH